MGTNSGGVYRGGDGGEIWIAENDAAMHPASGQ
jgi:hypothetical protein